MQVAIGLKARTGSASLVAVGGRLLAPFLIERSRIALLPEGAFAPYHAAAELEPAAARARVERSIAIAHELAETGIRHAIARLAAAGHQVCACVVLVGGGMPCWTTEEILAVHVRMHQAEGELFRDVLVAGARACGFDVTTLPDKSARESAARELGLAAVDLDVALAALGKSAGAPWRSEQRDAAAAALVALQRGTRAVGGKQ